MKMLYGAMKRKKERKEGRKEGVMPHGEFLLQYIKKREKV